MGRDTRVVYEADPLDLRPETDLRETLGPLSSDSHGNVVSHAVGKQVGIKNTCFRSVPDGCGLYHIQNDELLNGLILGHTGAANRVHEAVALLGTIVPSFLGHLGSAETRTL